MSDIGLDFPIWLTVAMLGVIYWPASLVVGILSGVVATLSHGFVRVLLAIVALASAGECVAAAWFAHDNAVQEAEIQADADRRHSTLEAPQMVDGLALPTGTAVEWTDATRTRLRHAYLPVPATLLGIEMQGLVADDSGAWVMSLQAPTVIDGWPCAPGFVHVSRRGELVQCDTAADHLWQGRLVPAGTTLGYSRHDGGWSLTLPKDRSMSFPEIPTVLPGTSSLSLNPDGSLASTYYEDDTPLMVAGVALTNTVSWSYPPSGPPANAVVGWLLHDVQRAGRTYPASTLVRITLPDGVISLD